MSLWLVILIGLLGGIMIGLQSPIVGAMGQRIGAIAGSLVIHISGTIFSAIFLFLRGGENIRLASGLPWYMLASGIFGVILFQTIYVTLPRLGGTMMVVLIIIGQLLMGLIVDHFGLLGVAVRPVDLTRLAGIVFLVAGGYLIAK